MPPLPTAASTRLLIKSQGPSQLAGSHSVHTQKTMVDHSVSGLFCRSPGWRSSAPKNANLTIFFLIDSILSLQEKKLLMTAFTAEMQYSINMLKQVTFRQVNFRFRHNPRPRRSPTDFISGKKPLGVLSAPHPCSKDSRDL